MLWEIWPTYTWPILDTLQQNKFLAGYIVDNPIQD
jgi:hypothetical protein